jgi:hypothetical protein
MLKKHLCILKRHWKITSCLLVTLAAVPASCTSLIRDKPYNHQECMDTVPKNVKGLKIFEGPRTEKSIINDMVPVGCYGRVIYERMKSRGKTDISGTITFKVTVEYTGEVYKVEIEDTTIGSEAFVKRLTDLIMDTDFTGWSRNETDTIFVYPMSFKEN